jgi:septal ring factor EnvC (AmiA/AmiB activator)
MQTKHKPTRSANSSKQTNKKPVGNTNSGKGKKFKPTFKEVYIKQSVLSDKDKQAICFLMEQFGEWASTKTVLKAVHELIELQPKYQRIQEENISLSRQLSDAKSKLEAVRNNLGNIQSLRKSIDQERDSIFNTLNAK